jgi:hypothetical protein
VTSLTKRLRAEHPDALAELAEVLIAADGSVTLTADVLGFAGPSTLWRIAADVPSVREILAKHGRGRGRKAP